MFGLEADICKKIDSLISHQKSNSLKLGNITKIQHEINPTGLTPFYNKEIYISLTKLQKKRKKLNRLIKLSVIQLCSSNFISISFIDRKRNGKIRIVMDYRVVNKHSLHIGYPLPKIKFLIQSLSGVKWFSQIGLNLEYYQTSLIAASQKFAAFALNGKMWEFLRMPSGLKNTSHTF